MTPQTINPPETIERYELLVPVEEGAFDESSADPDSSEAPTLNPLEGLSVDRIRLRPARRPS